jgi:hypothetical protein
LPFAKVKVNATLHRSVQANILLLDHDEIFWKSLTGVEKRLYLYLTKVFKTKLIYKRDVLELASQIPIQAKETKKKKQTLKDACNGLIVKGFSSLDEAKFVKGSDGRTDIIVFMRSGSILNKNQNWPSEKFKTNKGQYQIECLVEDILEVCGDEQSRPFYYKIARTVDDITIIRVLSEVKAVKNEGEIKTSPGKLFTFLIKKYTEEDKIAV